MLHRNQNTSWNDLVIDKIGTYSHLLFTYSYNQPTAYIHEIVHFNF